MQKFSFNKREDLLIPATSFFRPIKDGNDKPLSGENLLKAMEKIADKYETENERPVPIPDQKFLAWIRQYNKMASEGMASEKIFQRTISKI